MGTIDPAAGRLVRRYSLHPLPHWIRGRAATRVVLRALVACSAALPLRIGLAQTAISSGMPPAAGVSTADSANLDSLIARAETASPAIRAAAARAEAARHRVAAAGARPDPMLMAGVQNFPPGEPSFDDFMTMKMVGLSQTIPYPGKRSLSTRSARHELLAALAMVDHARLEVTAAVRQAYYDLAYLDRALAITDRNQRLVVDFMKAAEARYGVGSANQEDVLRLRIQAARMGEEAVGLIEQRNATLAQLNAVLDRESTTPVSAPRIPPRLARAAIADSAGEIRFVSALIGARAADSPLPLLQTLQEVAVRHNAMLRAQRATIAAQAARVELAQKAHLPDFDITLSYGQRDRLSDMVTALVSVPIPLQKGRKQDAFVAESRADLAAAEAEHRERSNAVRSEVARLHAELERDRAHLALYAKAILPQGSAAFTAAAAGYSVGRSDLLSLLDAQATLFTYETTYARILTDFARTLVELERIVGEEVLQ